MERLPRKSTFEIVHNNLRDTLRYLHRELACPADTIKLMVQGICTSFAVEDAYEQGRREPKPEGPA